MRSGSVHETLAVYISNLAMLTWKNTAMHLIAKYNTLLAAASSSEEKTRLTRLVNMCSKHTAPSAGPKGILIFSGRWRGLSASDALSLAQHISTQTSHPVYITYTAHPYTTALNAQELNPTLTGPASHKNFDSRFFYDSPVCLGEKTLTEEICFSYQHPSVFYLFCARNT